MHNADNTLGCSTCRRKQSCCTQLEIYPVPVLPGEVKDFGEENLLPWENDGDLFVIDPMDDGCCPHFDTSKRRCRLGDSSPAFCKAWPVLFDGDRWWLDMGCPAAGHGLIFKAVFGGNATEFLKRAFMTLRGRGFRMAPVVETITSLWKLPISIERMPSEWEREFIKNRRKERRLCRRR